MQVTYRVPSKKVQYGYLEFTKEDAGDSPEVLAEAYADFILRYQKAEKEAFETWTPATNSAPEADINDEVLNTAADTIKDSLGATEITEDAPWDKPTTETTNEKPWAASTSDDDWDFS